MTFEEYVISESSPHLEPRRTDMPRIPVINTSHLDRIDELLVDDFETGEFKLHRSVFTDQALFDLEMKYIFEGNWVFGT